MRVLALVLIVALTGPSAESLLCDWVCAARQEQTVAATGDCHDRPAPASAPTVAAGHLCHELAMLEASIPTAAPYVGPVAVAPAGSSVGDNQSDSNAHFAVPPPGAPPGPSASLIPLRI